MGLFSKKKPKPKMDIPPPPEPPEEGGVRELGDIEPIKPASEPISEIPKPKIEVPEEQTPTPAIPEVPEVHEISEIPEIPAMQKQPEFEEKPREHIRKPVGPVFVSVDEYRKIIDDSHKVRAKLDEAEEFIEQLNSMKQEEEKIFSKWQAHLESVEKKLSRIDRLLARKR